MNLKELAELFKPFGYSYDEVVDRLSAGDSVFNAFQGLKIELGILWDRASDKTEEMNENFRRIMNTTLKSSVRESDLAKERELKRRKMIKRLQDEMLRESNVRLNNYLDDLEKRREYDPKADSILKGLEGSMA